MPADCSIALLLFGHNVRHHPAEAIQDVDRRILSLRSEFARQDDVAVQDRARGVRDGIGEIISFYQDRVESR